MSIEVVAQPRIDHLVSAVDGSALRRTDYRGIAWFGGRQQPSLGGVAVIRKQPAVISSPFWLPDSIGYRSDLAHRIVVSIAAAAIFLPEDCMLADVSARLAPSEADPAWSHVFVQIQGNARVPLGISYDITVLAPPEALPTHR